MSLRSTKFENIDELRLQFRKINVNDPVALRKWFDDHPHLSANDHAQIANLSTKTIRIYRIRAGIKGKMPKTLPKHRIIKPPEPSFADIRKELTKEWYEEALKKHTIHEIARMIGYDRQNMKRKFKSLGLHWEKNGREVLKPKNQCANYEWLYYHYIVLELGVAECAKIAKVAPQTISDWLNRFGIPTRHRANQNLTWEKKLVYKLEHNQIVVDVIRGRKKLSVYYYNCNYKEHYCFNKSLKKHSFTVNQQDSEIKSIPLVYPEYGLNLDGTSDYPAHIAINKKSLIRATLIERRLAIHSFALQIIRRGWIQPFFPQQVIDDDYSKLLGINLDRYTTNDGFTCLVNGRDRIVGKKLIFHFFDTSHYYHIIRRYRRIVSILSKLTKLRVKFNFFNFLRLASAVQWNNRYYRDHLYGSFITNPAIYLAIFKKLGLTGTVLDLSLGMGSRAIACAAAQLTYLTADLSFLTAIQNGFLDFTNMKFEPYIDQNVDTVVYDVGFGKPNLGKVMPYLNKTKRLLVFTSSAYKDELLNYKPREVIKIETQLGHQYSGSLLVW